MSKELNSSLKRSDSNYQEDTLAEEAVVGKYLGYLNQWAQHPRPFP
jgi:hypothetical protein